MGIVRAGTRQSVTIRMGESLKAGNCRRRKLFAKIWNGARRGRQEIRMKNPNKRFSFPLVLISLPLLRLIHLYGLHGRLRYISATFKWTVGFVFARTRERGEEEIKLIGSGLIYSIHMSNSRAVCSARIYIF